MSIADLHFSFPGGKLRLIDESTDPAAEAGTVTIRPPSGKKWWFIDLWAWHDDSIDHSMYWNWQEGPNVYRCSNARGIGPFSIIEFAQERTATIFKNGRFPIIATHSIFPSMTFALNLNAGKIMHLYAVVLEIDDCVDPD